MRIKPTILVVKGACSDDFAILKLLLQNTLDISGDEDSINEESHSSISANTSSRSLVDGKELIRNITKIDVHN